MKTQKNNSKNFSEKLFISFAFSAMMLISVNAKSQSTIKLSNISIEKIDAQAIYQTTKQVYSLYLNISEPSQIDTLRVFAGGSTGGSDNAVFKFILKQREGDFFLVSVSNPLQEYFFNDKGITLTLFLDEPLPAYITVVTTDKLNLESNRISTQLKPYIL